jgi:Flp pilus assembly pilin Flp
MNEPSTTSQRLRSESGQEIAEYAMILALIAIGCMVAVLYFSGGVQRLFGSTTRPMNSAPMQPPDPVPTSVEQCQNGGWRNFPQFQSEAECINFVNNLGP